MAKRKDPDPELLPFERDLVEEWQRSMEFMDRIIFGHTRGGQDAGGYYTSLPHSIRPKEKAPDER